MSMYDDCSGHDDDYDDEDRYYAENAELESLATLMMDVEPYDDYFV